MDLGYADEKFSAAVHSIITLPETLTEHQKLEMAVHGTATVSATMLPEELQFEFQRWRDALTRIQDETKGSYTATIGQLSKHDVMMHLKTFADLYSRISWAYEHQK